MRLIVVAGLEGGVENGNALPEECACALGAFCLSNVALRQTRGLHEPVPQRAR